MPRGGQAPETRRGGAKVVQRITALPTPDGGWPHLLRLLAAVTALWAIAAFAAAAFLVPGMDPPCCARPNESACPRDSDPALTHLFAAAWPPVSEGWVAAVMFPAMVLAIGIAVFIGTSDPWSKTGGGPDAADVLATLTGIGIGYVVAGPGFSHPLIAVGVTGLGAVLITSALIGARALGRTLRRRFAVHQRIAHLRARGTREVATVRGFDWQEIYRDDEPIFTVTAVLVNRPRGREVTGELRVPRIQAPLVDGTVIVVHDDHAGHPTGVDFLIEADPRSPRDPEALEKYPETPESSPS